MSDAPWFKDGLRFECTGCGDCCTGSPGYVWVNDEEIAALAAEVGEDVESFCERYVRDVGSRRSLIEFSNGDCVFFDPVSRGCTVYGARPIQCRTWPFWESNVKSEAAWRRTCAVCPGSGEGRLASAKEILYQVSLVKV